jgi:hypothetical protein
MVNSINTNNCSIYLHQNPLLGLLEIEHDRTLSDQVKDVAQATLNGIKSIAKKNYNRLASHNTLFPRAVLNAQNIYEYPKEVLPWNEAKESNGIYFFIHGLFGFPSDWNTYVDTIQTKQNDIHVFVPHIPLKGNCSLETAGKPLLEALENYLKKFPGKPVTLIGTSNGGRLAAFYLESRLDPKILGNSSLAIVSIAGVHYGTKVIDFLSQMNFLPHLNDTFKEEILFGNKAAKSCLEAWHKKQSIWKEHNQKVRHLFCATTEDEQVRDISCSLPYHQDAVSTYKIVSGHSHTSIVEEMCDDVIQWIEEK